ncbi:hypothetical protein [Fictibacillus sp. 5RED26]|uniref:hypothetical protein n=1 Tax=Fictibacillus sp. 5RED26 TaxID=2745876 RepID=UPI00351CD10A
MKKLLTRSMAYLNELCGTSFDFSAEGQAKFLMLERCRYVYNNAADEFEKNFHHELARLILSTAVSRAGVTDGTT